jgi:hypothetical protein
MSEQAGAAPTQPVTPPVNPVFQAPPTGAPGGPPIPTMIPLTQEEYQRLRGIEREHADLTVKQRAALELAENARIKAIADKDGAEAALNEQRSAWERKLVEETTKFQNLERSLFDANKEQVLSSTLAGVTFAGDSPEDKAETARQLRAILEPQFETSRDATGLIITREKGTGRPAAEVLKEALASKRFAHFLASQSRPGSGGDGTRISAPAQQANPGSVQEFAARMAAQNKGIGGGFGQRRTT